MFTGIVEATGTVIAVDDGAKGSGDGTVQLHIRAGHLVADLPPGGSLAVNGVCLTSTSTSTCAASGGGAGRQPEGESQLTSQFSRQEFVADVMGETLARTTLGELTPGDTVNLERCVPATGRLDGHVVQGHVDVTGRIVQRVNHGAWETLRVSVPVELAPLVAEKGSIAMDGVSLTISAVSSADAGEHWFEVGLIPATLAATGLGTKGIGSRVNLEADVMAKYAARLAQFHGGATAQPGASPQHSIADPTHPRGGEESR
ncbi:riboflavin synthase [Kocuria sp.]|uniref:riboflavin synthase n=1 Tax=Kocuria sp. TaxID=1871328 RepID=UPI0026E029AA|nr:riboflavin synthase [Kocuria sp.]MDO5619822.1 riboflavin synthase [Kocuria sp.]